MTPEPQLLTSQTAARAEARSAMRTMHARGELVRIIPGVYVLAADWRALGADARYRLRVRAVAHAYGEAAQFSHDSAAALYRLPSLTPWPDTVHSVGPVAGGGRSRVLLRRHSIGLDADGRVLEGVPVTSLARTLVDVATSTSLSRAVAMLDDGLRPPRAREFRSVAGIPPVDKAQLRRVLAARASPRGIAIARKAIDLADGLSGSPLESLSRMQMHVLGFPTPVLQVPFYDEAGLIGYADFYWPELDLVGEADGIGKYIDPAMLNGLSTEQVVLAEKRREDRLRRQVSGFVRWDMAIARDRERFAAHLAPFGLRTTLAR